MAAKYKCAIIGCGKIAGGYDDKDISGQVSTHAKAYDLNADTELVSVCDGDRDKAAAFASRWGCKSFFVSAEEMLDRTHPDIVSICTPDGTHDAMLESCLRNQSVRAVWCEKPLGTSIETAEKIVAGYEKRSVCLAVNYLRRWNVLMNRVARDIRGGRVGDVNKAIVNYSGGILHQGSHAIDLLISWFGAAGGETVFCGLPPGCHDADPNVDGFFMAGNVPVVVIGSKSTDYEVFEIRILGSTGIITITDFGAEVEYCDYCGNNKTSANKEIVSDIGDRPAMSSALEDIIHALENGGRIRSDGRSAIQSLRVCCMLRDKAMRINNMGVK